ncbi:magnesium transporter [Alkalithermobacter paradoxus]|uniref:Magnesium transporter MgtE n=1 Tax=Alkalithermobacter paradoxus TaxID=29349 RepID=A0A1V4I776_9FIRM|nr:magnesium transporter MgtE [[Clostridium] thermoalcaliphilum]
MQNLKKLIWTHFNNKDIESLKEVLNNSDKLDVLNVIKELSSDERVIVYRLLSKDKALFVFEQLDTSFQQDLLSSFTEEVAIEMISELEPDDRVRLLDELPAKVAKRLIQALLPEEREKTALLMGYEEKTAGRIMTTEYFALNRKYTVEQAIEKIRQVGKEKETIYTIYIVDEFRKLEGVLSLRELIISSLDKRLEEIMNDKVVKVSTNTDQEEVAQILQNLDFMSVPVVDKENRLVGIITFDDAMDIIEEETTEDIFIKAGLTQLNNKERDHSQRLISGSLTDVWKVRLPFLIITMIGGLMAGAVIDVFEETLESIAATAIFIPVIMDMGGNAGTQSSTIFSRALILGHIKLDNFIKHLLREAFVGLSMVAFVGILTAILAFLWQGIPQLGIAVGLALAITMTLATSLGFLIPYILFKIGVDQAAGADPIITTIKDITGLLIYFMLVKQFLGYLL